MSDLLNSHPGNTPSVDHTGKEKLCSSCSLCMVCEWSGVCTLLNRYPPDYELLLREVQLP